MWSHPVAMDEMMVVSEMGETWSPKIPPEITAPIINGMFKSNVPANPKAMGIMIENVPHEVPVEKAVTPATKKINKGNKNRGSSADLTAVAM